MENQETVIQTKKKRRKPFKLNMILASSSVGGYIGVNFKKPDGTPGYKLPWKIRGEMEFFTVLTEKAVVIMGRKTYESIGKPLKGRISIILSSQPRDSFNNLDNDCHVVASVNDAIEKIYELRESQVTGTKHKLKGRKFFVIGGSEIYKAFLPMVTTIFRTSVKLNCLQHYNKESLVAFNLPKKHWKKDQVGLGTFTETARVNGKQITVTYTIEKYRYNPTNVQKNTEE